jgi:hypothetical protein
MKIGPFSVFWGKELIVSKFVVNKYEQHAVEKNREKIFSEKRLRKSINNITFAV